MQLYSYGTEYIAIEYMNVETWPSGKNYLFSWVSSWFLLERPSYHAEYTQIYTLRSPIDLSKWV